MRLCTCVLLVVAGCSAAGVPIAEPEEVTPLATAIPQSELEAIAFSIRDVVNAAATSLLRAPPGAVTVQLSSSGTLTVEGAAAQPGDAEESFSLTLAYDGYRPKINAAVPYTDWALSSAERPALTLAFTNEPLALHDPVGFIDGTFTGAVTLATAKSADPVDARLDIRGQLTGSTGDSGVWQLLHVSGVIYSPAFGYYYNDVSVPYAGQ